MEDGKATNRRVKQKWGLRLSVCITMRESIIISHYSYFFTGKPKVMFVHVPGTRLVSLEHYNSLCPCTAYVLESPHELLFFWVITLTSITIMKNNKHEKKIKEKNNNNKSSDMIKMCRLKYYESKMLSCHLMLLKFPVKCTS